MNKGTHRTDALILGAGVIGLASAYYLQQQGRSVRVVDPGPVGAGASQGNQGLITPSHALPLAVPGMVRKTTAWMLDPKSPFYLKPTLRPSRLRWFLRFMSRCNGRDMEHALHARGAILNSSRELYNQWMKDMGPACEWQPLGVLMVFKTEAAMRATQVLEEYLTRVNAAGVPVEGGALHRLEPALRNDVFGALHYTVDAHLRPEKLVDELARRVRADGGIIEEECEVRGIEAAGDTVNRVRTARGDFEAGEFVLAAGSWTPLVARPLGLHVPIQPGKGYSVTVAQPDGAPKHPCILHERNFAVSPWPSGLRIGGTMEFNGYNDDLNPARIEAILSGVDHYFKSPLVRGEQEAWTGWRPMTADDLPYIGRSPRHRNLTVAAGHGMMGMAMAPGTGKLVADLITGSTPHIDLAPYRLERP